VQYLADILRQVQCDGVAIHTYTHGVDPSLITSEARMNPPFEHRRYEFRAYQDFCSAIPPGLPIYITETDENDPWLDQNTGWVQSAYAEIDRWNQGGQSLIHCLALYRWPKIDQWYIEGKNGVIDDFRQAIAQGYQVRGRVLLGSPVPYGTPITMHFGANPEYYSTIPGYIVPLKGHNGVDFGCPMNTPITATDSGVVVRAGYDEWGFGLMIMLRHAWGQSLYAHLNNVCVGVGQEVVMGQQIAYSGKSGNATGPHLHFGIKPNGFNPADGWGGYVDPLGWILHK
jgi:murein DD-endopeptidase MepM/ murein hydrolase activator NlpD